MSEHIINHFHLFCGLGGGAKGFNRGTARVGQATARYKCLGGVDSDSAGIADFEQLSGVKGTVLDMFDRDQYIAWHGCEPPEDWREATPDDLRRAAGGERPHVIFTSPPCKGFSGLLSESKSITDKYQALNRLTVRGIWLALEAWSDDPPEFFLLENVPRIGSRGRALLDQIKLLLERYGYAVAETAHDCGELAGLAQSRKRFFLVARHQEKVPPFLYQPETKSLKPVGEVLGLMPLPGDPLAGPMHRVPSLEWKTWVRLAFVEAGKDWRSLQNLNVENGVLTDFAIVPDAEYQNTVLGVRRWDESMGVVAGRSGVSNGSYSVADPRWTGNHSFGQMGVKQWQQSMGTVSGQSAVGGGSYAVQDPRLDWHPAASRNKYKVIGFDQQAGTVIGARGPADGAGSIADPRMPGSNKNRHAGFYRVIDFNGQAHTVTGAKHVAGTAMSVADPRPNFAQKNGSREHYQTAGHYGVVGWNDKTGAVPGKAKFDRGHWSLADPRINAVQSNNEFIALPKEKDRGVFIIEALDGTWHRPFTTLELAAIQSLIDPEEYLELHGKSDSAWRERIGNAVPPDAAEAIAGVMAQTLLLAWAGETFVLSSLPIWVQPFATALSVDVQQHEELIGG
ncbi:MAG: DNA cytosine methyltransferase [Methyloprofundus sp.]|nr:DNA cytosine methyltransferase [Methyloprofundus sp.]